MSLYRREIDGLRTIAILPVLFFHFELPGFSGGFTGVDVFFVISGFLIGGILWAEHAETGRINLGAFYMRRIRRLAPAYFAVILCCLAVGWMVMLPFDYRALAKEIISSSVYLSNIYFFTEAGYFDTAAKEKVLLHTWSLSVEEQFYIVLPPLLLTFSRLRKSLPLVLGVLALTSLVACIALTPSNQTATFYLFPFRAWELLAGVLLAIVGYQRKLNWDIHTSLSWIGLVLIAVAVFGLSESPAFPGWQACLPVLGTVLLIANGQNANLVNRMLSHPWPVFIGLISYSLYLWHWPILTFWNYVMGDLGSLLTKVALVAGAMVIAALSWRLIEAPTRRANVSAATFFGATAAATTTALAAGAVIYLQDGLTNRFNQNVVTHIAATQDFLQDWSRCTTPRDGAFAGIEICPIGPEGDPQLLIWGDSHVRAFKEGLEEAAFEAGVPALIIWRAGCPPLFGIEKIESTTTAVVNAYCFKANERIRTALEDSARFPTVLLIGRWAYYAQGHGVGRDLGNAIKLTAKDPTLPAETTQADLLGTAMVQSIAQIVADGREVFVLQQPPEIINYHSIAVSRALVHGRLTQDEAIALATTSISDLRDRNVEADAILARLHEDTQAQVLQSWNAFCSDEVCSAMTGGFAGYFDNNHITNTNARRVKGLFDPVFAAVKGEPL